MSFHVSETSQKVRGIISSNPEWQKHLDHSVYEKLGRDPLEPLLFSGNPKAGLAILGRDPGKDEIKLQTPLIGAAGKTLRKGLFEYFVGGEPKDIADYRKVEDHVFFVNTVPYKPKGNLPWAKSLQDALAPEISKLLVEYWRGDVLFCLGTQAWNWFSLNMMKEPVAVASTEELFSKEFSVALTRPGAQGKSQKQIRVFVLPHPSPLNIRWKKRFPEILKSRLKEI